jgi:hypothetical protein
LRLWRVVLREGGSPRIADDLSSIEGLLSTTRDIKQEGLKNGQ